MNKFEQQIIDIIQGNTVDGFTDKNTSARQINDLVLVADEKFDFIKYTITQGFDYNSFSPKIYHLNVFNPSDDTERKYGFIINELNILHVDCNAYEVYSAMVPDNQIKAHILFKHLGIL